MHIVQLANFVSPTSGGIRRVLDRLREGYRAAGHRSTLVIPGPDDSIRQTPCGDLIHVAAPILPASGGYRVITDPGRVRRLLTGLRPDRIEVHDRFTLRGLGDWAAEQGVPSMLVVHERFDRLLPMYLPWVLRPSTAARRDNARLAARFDTVVTPSRWAAEEFTAAGVGKVEVVGWGVDTDVFHPGRRSEVVRRHLAAGHRVLLAMVCRLSPEKKPDCVIDAVRVLRRRGVDVQLVVAGQGQMDRALRRAGADLPIKFLGNLDSRVHVAELLAAADLAVCPGPIETFGLAAAEALACGTPVVASQSGAIGELLAPPFGRTAYNHGPTFAAAIQGQLAEGAHARRAAADAATHHRWSTAVGRMLDLHARWAVSTDFAMDHEVPT